MCNVPLKKNNSVFLSKSTTQSLLLTQIPLKQKAVTINQYNSKRLVNSPQMTFFHKKLYPFIAPTYNAIERIKHNKSKYNTQFNKRSNW